MLSVRGSCGGSGSRSGTGLGRRDAGSGWTVGVKSEDWKIEESEMNIVKSGTELDGAGERNEMCLVGDGLARLTNY